MEEENQNEMEKKKRKIESDIKGNGRREIETQRETE